MGVIGTLYKILLVILVLTVSTYSSNFGSIVLRDSTGNNLAYVEADSSLRISTKDTFAVSINPSDTINIRTNSNDSLKVLIQGQPIYISPFDTSGNKMWDAITGAMMIIDYEHHEIHSGSHFIVEGVAVVAANDSLSFGFYTRDTTAWKHITWSISGTGQTSFSMWENATFDTTSGTAVSAINNNRNSVKTCTCKIRENPTFSVVGDSLLGETFGTTTNPATQTPGSATRANEIILKQNAYYRFRLKNGNSTNRISYRAAFYEHINKN